MALIKCPECGKEVSTAAKACPHCGFPLAFRNETQTDENMISLYTFYLQKSFGLPIGSFILIEILIGINLGFCFAGMHLPAIIGTSFYCASLEAFSIFAMIYCIIEYKKLNNLSGNELKYDPSEKVLIFEDVNCVLHKTPIDKIIQIDGPFTMKITYTDSFSKARKKAIVGNTCKADVLSLREKIGELKQGLSNN